MPLAGVSSCDSSAFSYKIIGNVNGFSALVWPQKSNTLVGCHWNMYVVLLLRRSAMSMVTGQMKYVDNKCAHIECVLVLFFRAKTAQMHGRLNRTQTR